MNFSGNFLSEFSWTFLVNFRGHFLIVMIRVTLLSSNNLTQTLTKNSVCRTWKGLLPRTPWPDAEQYSLNLEGAKTPHPLHWLTNSVGIKKCPLEFTHEISPKEKNSRGQKMSTRFPPQAISTRIHSFWKTRIHCPHQNLTVSSAWFLRPVYSPPTLVAHYELRQGLREAERL